MPDLINPLLSSTSSIEVPQLPPTIDTDWIRPTVQIPDILKQSDPIFPGNNQQIPLSDFTKGVNQKLTPQQTQDMQDEAAAMSKLTLGYKPNQLTTPE